jgi:DNA-binding transcriptional LysR family regulator
MQAEVLRFKPADMQLTEWGDFQAFFAIAREGNLAEAAKSLRVDATTMGRRLRRLEARLGQRLFEKTREGQILTEAGEQLLTNVETMAVAASAITPTGTQLGGPSGTLRISVSEGFGTSFLAPRLGQFTKLYPRLTVDLVASSSYLSLSKREADLAIFLSRPKAGALIARRLTPYGLRLYASARYIEQHGSPDTADELSEHRLVGYIPDLLYAPELRYLDEIKSGLSASIRSSSINAQLAILISGAGIGVLPCFMGDASPTLARILPQHRIERNFWVVTHSDTHKLAKVSVFNSWLRSIVQFADRQALLG